MTMITQWVHPSFSRARGALSAIRSVRGAFCWTFMLTVLLAGMQVRPAHAQQSADEIALHLKAIDQLTQQALEASRNAQAAETVADVKRHADAVFTSVWGTPSGIAAGGGGEKVHGWKTRWQVDTDDFELETPEKFGILPPEITDPAQLGIVGRGRHVRILLTQMAEGGNAHYGHTIASLSNVIGWMKIDYAPARGGMPRVDLTAQWDAPTEFWLSTADTGWIFEVYSQALNILKTDYAGDVAAARAHAAAMTELLEKVRTGVDANGNDAVEPAMMEGGLDTALQHAALAGIRLR